MKYKVVLVLNEAPIPFAGAASRWYYSLITELYKSDFQIEIFASCATQDHAISAKKLFPNGNFYTHPIKTTIVGKIQTFLRPFSYSIPAQMKIDFNLSISKGYDLIHIEQTFSSWILNTVPKNCFLSIHYLSNIDLLNVKPTSIKESILLWLMKYTEKKLISRFHHIKSCSSRIEDVIKDWYPKKDFIHFPFAIDYNLYNFLAEKKRIVPNTITLIANMNWHPGKTAALRLLNEIWPEVKKENPNLVLRIVGWNAKAVLIDYLNLTDVEIIENVKDITEYFYNSTIFVYPPTDGSGIKIKIQEAMLLGIPVITNQDGIEGLSAVHREHVLLAQTNNEFVSQINELINNVPLQNKLRINARKLIQENYSGEQISISIKKLYSKIIEGQNNV